MQALAERRRCAVKLREKGMRVNEVARACELSRGTVIAAHKTYCLGGWTGMALKPCGRSTGAGRRLNTEQEREVQKLIRDETPDQIKMPYALWGRTAVIAERAKVENAEIHWGDETGLRSDDVRGRSFAPKGKALVVRVNSKRENVGLIYTVTNQGKVRWMVLNGALDSDRLIVFLKRLERDAKRKVFLIQDNFRVHHAKLVKAWLAKHQDEIEVFYLPSDSPELNSDEMLNADLKQAVTTKAPARTKGQLLKTTTSQMRKLQKLPERVKSDFAHTPVKDAA
ncbi:transposase [Candidatus Nitrotoga sp. BS]|nr:transposase [Candidatus Nitrotoga sp. BS]